MAKKVVLSTDDFTTLVNFIYRQTFTLKDAELALEVKKIIRGAQVVDAEIGEPDKKDNNGIENH